MFWNSREKINCPTVCYAATDKAARLLHWHAEKDLADMCRDSWRWQQSQQ